MSWFSKTFLRPPEDQQSGINDAEEDEPSPRKGVKEDLSELSKTFSRQLRGVASFLAPSPQPDSSSNEANDEAFMAPSAKLPSKSSDAGYHKASVVPLRLHGHTGFPMAPPSPHDVDEEGSVPFHTDSKPPAHHHITDKGAVSMADDALEESSLHHSQIKQANRPLITEGLTLSEELVDVDFEVSTDEALEGYADSLKGPDLEQLKKGTHLYSSSHPLHHQSSDLSLENASHGLTGISRDLAELKGTMTSGFSRILKVVKEEVEQEETLEFDYHDHSDDEETADDTAGSMNTKKFQGINMFLRPLFSNVHPQDESLKRADASFDEDEAYGDDLSENPTSQSSSHAHASMLQDTFIDSFKGISDFASSLLSGNLHLGDEKDLRERERSSGVVGITEEVLTFARNISMHPETWLDFPLFSDNDEDGEFVMSSAQREHVNMLELMIPRLAELRAELCPDCMSEGSFWKIYFVLLHSRLHEVDAVILSTPKVMEARVRLLKKLQEEGDVEEMKSGRKREVSMLKGKEAVGTKNSIGRSSLHSALEVQANDFGQLEDLEADIAEEVQNKSVLVNTIKLAPSNYEGDEANTNRWLHEEPLPRAHSATLTSRSEEDVSFSDLEEEDEPTSKSVVRSESTHSFGWIQLSKHRSEEDFEGLRASEKAENRGYRREDGGSSTQDGYMHSSAQASKKQDQKSESSDWSTFEDDDVASGE